MVAGDYEEGEAVKKKTAGGAIVDASTGEVVHESQAYKVAIEIRAHLATTVQAVFDVGTLLIDAKNALGHGEFQTLFNAQHANYCGFGGRTGRYYMAIATSDRLIELKRKHASILPTSWMTLHEIAALPAPVFQSALSAGVIRADMERKDVSAFKRGLKEQEEQHRRAAASESAPTASDRYAIFPDDCETATAKVDWIITDPPYERGLLDCYNKLARVAERTLKPGGSLLCMTGQSYLPEVFVALCEYLRYHWTLAYLTPGGQAVQLFPKKVNTFWKPVLWFTQGEYPGGWIGDVTKSDVNDNDKRFHEWGQSESGMHDLMRRFVRPGDTVLDPFMGAGTTGIVALSLGARFIGYDSSAEAFDEAKARLSVFTAQAKAA